MLRILVLLADETGVLLWFLVKAYVKNFHKKFSSVGPILFLLYISPLPKLMERHPSIIK